MAGKLGVIDKRSVRFWAERIADGLKIRSLAERDAMVTYLSKDVLPSLIKEIASTIRRLQAK